MNMTCHPCRGTGHIRVPTTPFVDGPTRIDRECERCLGIGHVYSRGLAHALEAWRWLRERSREREALAFMRVEIPRIFRDPEDLRPLFAHVPSVLDTLDEASGGLDGRDFTAGYAMWVGRRWVKATGDMVAGGRLTWRQRRAQHAFWQDVCPGVVDLLVAVDEPTQVQMDLMEK